MELSEIRHQSLHTLVTKAYVCAGCAIVDSNDERYRVGFECPCCGDKSHGALSYFSLPVHAVVDLMQEVFHLGLDAPMGSSARAEPSESATNHRLAIVVYYSTFSELLLEHTIRELMIARNVRRAIQDRMLVDHPFAKARVEKLFPALADMKWKDAIVQVSIADTSFSEIVAFTVEVITARNTFLHQGNRWAVRETLPRECINATRALVNLHVALHNAFIQPIYAATSRRYHWEAPEDA
jgi:hypothetical protein